jgi:hypothetical protein
MYPADEADHSEDREDRKDDASPPQVPIQIVYSRANGHDTVQNTG